MRSKSKHRSKRVRTSQLAEFAEKQSQAKRIESDGFDFFFLLLGMVSTLLAALLFYSNLNASPAAGRALAAAAKGEATEEVNAIDTDDEFQELVNSSNKAQLINVLTGLNKFAKVEVTPVVNQRRVDSANQLLTMSLSSSERRLAVVSKLEALGEIYEMTLLNEEIDIPNVAGTLRDTAMLFKDESDESIRRIAKISHFKVNSLEMRKKPDPDIGKITNGIFSLLSDLPDDDEAISTVRQVVAYYRLHVDRRVCQKITNKLNQRIAEFSSPKSLRLIHEFSDEAMLLDAKYAELFENRDLDGARGQRELLKKSIELAGEPEAGERLIEEVDAVAHWFEQASLFENESKIYQEFQNSVDNYRDPEVAAVARKKAEDGMKRIALQGKTIDLTGYQFDGSKIPTDAFNDKYVVVLFWSMDDTASMELLKTLNDQVEKWNQNGVCVLAVNIDQRKSNKLRTMFAEMSNINFVFGDANRNYVNEILDQCPSSVVPRVMLVNRDGTVANVNVSLKEVSTEVDFLVGN